MLGGSHPDFKYSFVGLKSSSSSASSLLGGVEKKIFLLRSVLNRKRLDLISLTDVVHGGVAMNLLPRPKRCLVFGGRDLSSVKSWKARLWRVVEKYSDAGVLPRMVMAILRAEA
jgi:hypothetical protein